MNMIRKLAGSLALAAITIQPTFAAPAKCISSADFRAGAKYVVPIAVDGVSAKCLPVLGSTSYLAAKGRDLAKRYDALPGDESAVAALVERFDSKGTLKDLSVDDLRVFIKVGFASVLNKDFKPELCGKIDKVLSLVDPLPAENTTALFEFIIREVEAGEGKRAIRTGKPFQAKMCPLP